MHFFLDGVIEIALQSIETSKKITKLREDDMRKIQALGKREANSGVSFLKELYRNPIVTNASVAKEMKFSRSGATKIIERFINLKILNSLDENVQYGKTYIYRNYVDIFNEN